MAINEKLAAVVGKWQGMNKLNLSWLPDPIKESPSNADVRRRADGQCLEIEYDWIYEAKTHTGFILIDGDGIANAHAVWTDSWHSANVIMSCEGSSSPSGAVNVKGHYKVEGHPDWGWRTEIIPAGDSFKYLMFNVTPEGLEEWAVEMEFTRA